MDKAQHAPGYPRPMNDDDLVELLKSQNARFETLRARIAELEALLSEIAAGHIDEGGNRRNHDDATAIARKFLKLE